MMSLQLKKGIIIGACSSLVLTATVSYIIYRYLKSKKFVIELDDDNTDESSESELFRPRESIPSIRRRQERILSYRPHSRELESVSRDMSEDSDEYFDYQHQLKFDHAIEVDKYEISNVDYLDGKGVDVDCDMYYGYSSNSPLYDYDSEFFDNLVEDDYRKLSDWNRRFRHAIRRMRKQAPTAPLIEKIEANLTLMNLSQDFIYSATSYGKIIISEYYLPYEKKTIKPVLLGGIIGGHKYVVHNILFKFAVDKNGLFGNDYSAAKVAGNELRGLISYFNSIEEANVPLMALVDYRGFRLIAMSILPVNNSTIVYGSCDAGRHIYNKDSGLTQIIAKGALKQNSKPHFCRVTVIDKPDEMLIEVPKTNSDILLTKSMMDDYENSLPDQDESSNYDTSLGNAELPVDSYDITLSNIENNDKQVHRSESKKIKFSDKVEYLYSPADLEGHLGLDGRYYLLDFSRAFPPETPDVNFKNSHLVRLLRPEFVQQYPYPLCPDAFSGFIVGTEGEKSHNDEVIEATNFLIDHKIPSSSENFMNSMSNSFESKHPLTETIHSYGINCRHLGHLRNYVNKEFKKIILIEVVARVIKNILRFKLREKMKKLKLPLEEPYRRLVIDYLNLVFGNSKRSDKYWNSFLKRDIERNFKNCLDETEQAGTFNLKLRDTENNIDIKFLESVFDRFIKMMGIDLSPIINNDFTLETPFDDTDLESIGERVKHMNIIAHAQGYFYHVKGLANRVEDTTVAKTFYSAAIEKFQEALNTDPNNKEILLSMALTWILMVEEGYKHVPNAIFSLDDPMVQKAEEYSLRAITVSPTYDSFSAFRYAQFLERCGKKEAAEDYYLMALEADPRNAGCLHCYGMLLTERGCHDEAEKFFNQASKNTIGVKNWPQWYH